MTQKGLIVTLALALALTACGKSGSTSDTDDETSQQVGDTMASMDESSGSSSGTIALNELTAGRRTFARLDAKDMSPSWVETYFEAQAEAGTCLLNPGFGSCTSNTITRTFGGCTIGLATLTGTVTLTWGGGASSCHLTGANQTITRVPDWTLTGLRSATLTSTKTGTNGQVLTYVSAGNYTFSSDGIERKFVDSSGSTLFDFTTSTTSNLIFTGASRSGRTLTSGTIHIVNNLTGTTCDLSPSSVTWGSGCNCATSGTWKGTCSNGNTTEIDITGCGTANLTSGSATGTVSFDRCYGA